MTEKISKRVIFAFVITFLSIYLVFMLNPDGALRILLNLLTFAGIYGLSAIGLNVHFGWTGLLNFGHASFMGVGAYVTLLLMPHAAGREGEITSTGLPFLAALVIGILSAALFGLSCSFILYKFAPMALIGLVNLSEICNAIFSAVGTQSAK